ncbi:hypothetical protein [Halorarum halobium]|uniref:hypothetical protein n=1 Tax=Halorarum halobium TaxID=3075121 RepID=UPI0028B02F0E|nr:hypothetical protein [Halobaculum sp. XH14]
MADPDDYRLAQYRELREEIRAVNEKSTTTMTRGIGACGLIAAYGLYQPSSRVVIAVIPVVVGVLFVVHALNMCWVARLATHIVELQNSIDVDGFDWEREYGMFRSDETIWERVPRAAFYALLCLVYGGTVVAGVSVVDAAELATVFGTSIGLLARLCYLLISCMMLVAAYSYLAVAAYYEPARPFAGRRDGEVGELGEDGDSLT